MDKAKHDTGERVKVLSLNCIKSKIFIVVNKKHHALTSPGTGALFEPIVLSELYRNSGKQTFNLLKAVC